MAHLTDEDTLREVETKKWRFAYNEVGPADGHPVVLLHGSGPGAIGWSNFNQNLGPLGEQFHCLAVDMPGWGRSDTAAPDDRDHVEALELFLDALGIERAALIGNSMGGGTAIRLSATYPDRVTHLVSMGSGAPGVSIFTAQGGLSEGLKALVHAYEDPSLESFRSLIEVLTFDSSFATDALVQQRRDAALANPDHLQNYLDARRHQADAMARMQGVAAALPTIDVPALIIHGRDDRTVHFEGSLRLVSLMQNARLVLLARCGHWAQLEHAAEFNRLVTDFVTHHER